MKASDKTLKVVRQAIDQVKEDGLDTEVLERYYDHLLDLRKKASEKEKNRLADLKSRISTEINVYRALASNGRIGITSRDRISRLIKPMTQIDMILSAGAPSDSIAVILAQGEKLCIQSKSVREAIFS